MTTFGFSAFLKLISSSSRSQRTQIRTRLTPSDGGYDYHKAMRRLAGRYLIEGISASEILAATSAIVKEAERKSAVGALTRLIRWRESFAGEVFQVPERLYESPTGVFRIRYAPDFGMSLDGERIAAHVWNTMKPPLDKRMSRAGLFLFHDLYDDIALTDLSVLSLRDNHWIRLGDPAVYAELSLNLVEYLEETFIDVRRDAERTGTQDRPPAP